MKRTALAVVMMVSAVALFANGAQENDWEPTWNPVEMTGTVSIVDDYPVLAANGRTYLLGAPRAAWYLGEVYPIGRMAAFGRGGPAVAMRGRAHGGPFGRFDDDDDDDWGRGPARPGDPRAPRGRR
jgi:hypothetical protein